MPGPHREERELRGRHLLGPVAEADHLEPVAGKPGSDQVGERERHLLRRREAVLVVEDHRVRAVEEEGGGHRLAGLGEALDQVFLAELGERAGEEAF